MTTTVDGCSYAAVLYRSDGVRRSLDPPRWPPLRWVPLRWVDEGGVESTQTNDDLASSQPEPAAGDFHALPSHIDRFIVLGLLGRGGMSSVLRAYDPSLDRQVAIKVMLPGMHEGRMMREAQALARVSHPNVVQIFEIGETSDRLFIAMELVAGETLQRWQHPGHPWRQCVETYVQAGRGLAAVHAAGLVHRDFKPANCILDETGHVRVLDFGLVRHDGEPVPGGRAELEPTTNALQERITQTRSIVGTRAYMAPEQVAGGVVDARSDQFSFCVSLYEALFGQLPFTRNPVGTLLRLASGEAIEPLPPPGDRHAPRWLIRALWRGLSGSPEARWPSIPALLAELERHLRRRKAHWIPWVLAIGGIAWTFMTPTSGVDAANCEQTGGEAAAVWSPERKARVRARMAASELPYAPELWSKVEPRLDLYVDALASSHVAACEVGAGPDGPRRRCLETLRGTLDRTIALLEEADAGTTEQAADVVASLPGLDSCLEAAPADGVGLARAPERAERISELRGRLQVARILERATKLGEAQQELAAVLVEAESLDEPTLLTEIHAVEGLVLLADGRIDPARARLGEAYERALELGLGKVALEAAISLAYLVGVSQAQSDAGLWLGSTAESLAKRHDPGGQLEAESLVVLAQVLVQRGQLAEAEQRYRDALALLDARVKDDDPALIVPLNGLGQVLRRQGRLPQAQAYYERALALRIEVLGRGHPQVAYQRINLGVVLMEQRRTDAAEAQYERAREILEALPSQRELLAELHTNLGVLRNRQGRTEKGEFHLQQAIGHWEALYGSDHPWVAQARMSLGANLERRGRDEPAAEQYRRALQILASNEHTPSNDEIRFRLFRSLAEVRRRQGKADEAEQHYQRAREMLLRLGRDSEVEAARLLNRLGELHSTQGRFEQAMSDHEAALEILDALAQQDRRRVETLLLWSRAAYAAGRPREALERVERALELAPSLADDERAESIAEGEELRGELVRAIGALAR
ncbi:serine/threonine-protein kinase [Paraliomyxa miuraensis]|uniref:serine/threonine-protein kinase n=1 Tax=Paraliomyxa miuraensis TaxID=376150 RepID=UPI002250453F|nr:serine/threonine-protein kinase [Paraliomyxa miuraensis]MCX4246686.1 tetratricopeptide repeat protein [Paraliomyxa miuraensis]